MIGLNAETQDQKGHIVIYFILWIKSLWFNIQSLNGVLKGQIPLQNRRLILCQAELLVHVKSESDVSLVSPVSATVSMSSGKPLKSDIFSV